LVEDGSVPLRQILEQHRLESTKERLSAGDRARAHDANHLATQGDGLIFDKAASSKYTCVVTMATVAKHSKKVVKTVIGGYRA
jgi:hypothetical protein